MILWVARFCAPPADAQTQIDSEAGLEFSAIPGGAPITLTSNMVTVMLMPPLNFELLGQETLNLPPGGLAYFFHTLTNNAPGAQTFALSYEQPPGDDFALDDLLLFVDENGNGLIDLGEPSLASGDTVTIDPGASLQFILRGRVPLNADPGRMARPTISARETIADGTATRSNLINTTERARVVGLGLGGLVVEKSVSRPAAEVGETVDYIVTVTNVSIEALPVVTFEDRLPVGFMLVPGTLQLNGVSAPDPVGGASRVFTHELGALAPQASATISYRARIGVNALNGDGINRATAQGVLASSNVGVARVRVESGVFSDEGLLIGRVFVDANANQIFDAGDLGVPGVRLYLLDGTHVTTDIDGKYSVYGLTPRTNVLKLDTTTLPPGTRIVLSSHRQAGDPGSRFIDLKRHELHKANFIVASDSPALEEEIARRRDALAPMENERFGRQLETRLRPDQENDRPSDVRAQPAAGVITPAGAREDAPSTALTPALVSSADGTDGYSAPLVAEASASGADSSAAPSLSAAPVAASVDNTLGFADLADGQTLLRAQTDIRVKGPAGGVFSLHVNDDPVPASKIGQQESDRSRNLDVWTYVGIDLKPGPNRLRVGLVDPFGNARGERVITVIAPGPLARLRLIAPEGELVADGSSANSFVVELIDEDNVPVGRRTPVTLATTAGVWRVLDVDQAMPGVQSFIEGGRGVFDLVSPGEPGAAAVQITTGLLMAETEVSFHPNLRPLIAVGLIEGTLNFGSRGGGGLMPVSSRDAFEEELRNLSATGDDGRLGLGARAAFFLKGKIKGDFLLTAAFDSEKESERLFRDIRPDEFYPVYGDSSVRGFDAQSTGRLYVRIDKNRSYLLLGDFTTRAVSPVGEENLHALGSYQRSLNGVKQHYENDRVRANAWVSQDSTRQVVDEVPADGTSGPYFGNLGNAIVNSERVEILVRDRDQPSRVIEVTPLARFFDYDFEPFSGRLLLRAPAPSLDANLNPVSLRITYEVESGGEAFWVYGADGQVKVTDRLTMGGTFARDEDPADNYQLLSGAASYRFAERTTLTAEVAQSDSELNGDGMAGRVDFKHRDERTDVHAYLGRTDEGFRNPGALFLPGRVEGGFKASRKLAPGTTLIGQGLYTEDLATGGRRHGVRADIEQAFGSWRVSFGARYSDESAAPAGATTVGVTPNSFTSLRTKITAPVPLLENASGYVEYEQDIADAESRMLALGFDHTFKKGGRAYARHELISSLGGPFELNPGQRNRTTVFGLEQDYMKGGKLFNEYRASNEIYGREAESALGLRNLWELRDGVNARTSFEHIEPIKGTTANQTTAVTAAIDFSVDPAWRGNARVEFRTSDTTDSFLNSLGYARQLDEDWTLLARTLLLHTTSKGAGGGDLMQSRFQVGMAWRPKDSDRWNALGKYELKAETDDRAAATLSRRLVHIISSDYNYQPEKDWIFSGHHAAKWVRETGGGATDDYVAHLVAGRVRHEFGRRWDIGLNVSAFFDQDFDQARYALGPELGVLIGKNINLGIGYNFVGFYDRDLATDGTTQRGVFLRLRLKFDENSLAALAPNSR